MVSLEFDPSVNALYVRIREGKVASTEPLADNVVVDLDEEGRVLGIEVLLPLSEELKRKMVEALKCSVSSGTASVV
ncbi:MAG: DUF2283 domain-containing protein [Thermoproteota archaeon]|nr:MAG: DUF2283 domain-containing protein [Candidatus Korarchaeota archaeon]